MKLLNNLLIKLIIIILVYNNIIIECLCKFNIIKKGFVY